MKHLISLLMLSAAVLPAVASAPRSDAATRLYMASASDSSHRRAEAAYNGGSAGTTYIPAIIKYDKLSDFEALEGQGVIVIRHRGNLALVLVPSSDAERVMTSRYICSMSAGRTNTAALDTALRRYDAIDMHKGDGNSRLPYTGKGIVTGMCDIGFDPHHPTFGGTASGDTPRLARMVIYEEREGRWTVADDPAADNTLATDNQDEWHGTHVAGILAGNGAGTEYVGLAPSSTLVATVSQLSDIGLLAGVEDIIEYASEAGMPAVVNLSMGNYLGPHDGTSLFSQYMDMLGEEAIICMSTGNEGMINLSLDTDLTPLRKEVLFRLHNKPGDNYHVEGMTDIWSSDGTPLRIRIGVCDDDTAKPVWMGETLAFDGDRIWDMTFGASDGGDGIGKYLEGNVCMAGGTDPENGRYNITVAYDYNCTDKSNIGRWARYTLLIEVSLADGNGSTHVNVFADGIQSRLREMPGYPAPGTSFSVSDLCTGRNVIGIGMYNNRSTAPALGGGVAPTGYVAGEVCPHSSYGTLSDGTVMPHTVAPGAPLVSAVSGAWAAAHPDEFAEQGAAVTVTPDGVAARWIAEGGTSMSSPYTAGTIACWLEANPALGVADIKEILAATNRHDYPDPDNPRHGQGWLDPVAGLVEAVRRADSGSVGDVSEALRIRMENGRITLVNATGGEAAVEVVDMAGRVVARMSAPEGVCVLGLPGLPAGVYIVNVSAGDSRTTAKYVFS